MVAYKYILEKIRGLCNYVLDYCDMQTGCQTCELQGIDFGDSSSKCPIYVISMLDDALYEDGIEIKE